MALEDFFTRTLEILIQGSSGVLTKDTIGADERTPYTTLHTLVPYLERPTGVSDEEDDDRQTDMRVLTVYLLADYSLSSEHVLKIGTRYLHVIGQRDFNKLGRLFAVECIEVVG